MAQFYASIQGARGEATRLGHKTSGITGHIRGWNLGGRVNMEYDERAKIDVCEIEVTSGSGGGTNNVFGKLTARRPVAGEYAVMHASPGILWSLDDASFEGAMLDADFAKRLKALVFLNLDKTL